MLSNSPPFPPLEAEARTVLLRCFSPKTQHGVRGEPDLCLKDERRLYVDCRCTLEKEERGEEGKSSGERKRK